MSNVVRMILQWSHLENAPQRSRRKIRQLERQMAEKDTEIALLEIRHAGLQDDYFRMESTVRTLLTNEVAHMDQIAELEKKLETAIRSSWSNDQMIRFRLFDFNDPTVDSSTQAIDVSDLRADLAEPKVAVITKITQVNPETGCHDTVELHLPKAPPEPAPRVTFRPPGYNGSVSPAHVPGDGLGQLTASTGVMSR